ncbi:MAG: bifunctional methylenetetrahydrofolate dehydrogenase/methenyltetrahydrofolate cyclohydrolase FolD [Gammaproteobacteria bacterium]
MTAKILDGKALSKKIRAELKEEIQKLSKEKMRPPGLAVVLVGKDPASEVYVRNKSRACEEIGIQTFDHHYEADFSEDDLQALIQHLNNEEKVDGILVQLPLPAHINADDIVELIHPNKDVDGFHPYNLGQLTQNRTNLRSCTPYGIMKLLETAGEPVKGKHVVIIGASNIVGRPMALECLNADYTVTVCHKYTKNIAEHIARADIVISAVGKPHLIKGEWIKEGSIVIDVGTTRLEDGSFAGDVEFDIAKERASYITPVPGGVGPMTVAMLLVNTVTRWKLS